MRARGGGDDGGDDGGGDGGDVGGDDGGSSETSVTDLEESVSATGYDTGGW